MSTNARALRYEQLMLPSTAVHSGLLKSFAAFVLRLAQQERSDLIKVPLQIRVTPNSLVTSLVASVLLILRLLFLAMLTTLVLWTVSSIGSSVGGQFAREQ